MRWLLGWREAAIDERFLQIRIALVVQCLSEDFEDAPQHADADPPIGLLTFSSRNAVDRY
jgi:hypothetical protein